MKITRRTRLPPGNIRPPVTGNSELMAWSQYPAAKVSVKDQASVPAVAALRCSLHRRDAGVNQYIGVAGKADASRFYCRGRIGWKCHKRNFRQLNIQQFPLLATSAPVVLAGRETKTHSGDVASAHAFFGRRMVVGRAFVKTCPSRCGDVISRSPKSAWRSS